VTGTLLVSGAMALGLAPLASAGSTASTPAPASTLAPITHPDSDSLGSTIRAHDPAAVSQGTVTPKLSLSANAVVAPPYGMDVSNYQGNINWAATKAAGAAFVYIKATESTTYQNSYFAQQYNGSYAVGMIRGAYHFALPDRSSGATQAQYFVAHGGGWSADGHTLPPMLDVEYNPYGASTCYGLSAAQMVGWIRDFSNTVHSLTTRYPVIYSTADWWNTCTGSNATFGSTNPLFIARYASTVGAMPAGWAYQSIWQYNDHGAFPGDADVFNGSAAQLLAFAGTAGSTPTPTPTPSPAKPPVATPAPTPIDAYYASLGGASSYLGAATSPLYAVTGGQGRNYKNGNIYYSAATGAHAVHGARLARYRALRGSLGYLGFPTTDETSMAGGIYQNFSGTGGSSLYWTPAHGAYEVLGQIRLHWLALGGASGFLGFPLTDESASPIAGARYNLFANGEMLWSAATGPHAVNGAIRLLWAKLGHEGGRLGLPTTDEFSVPGGRQSNFQHGHITWLASTRVATVYYS
jgi:GH25 family lysozyme M1 (1,4-beta-N-acetylmuramidase)